MPYDDDQGYDPSDPKHPTYADRMADLADEMKERERELIEAVASMTYAEMLRRLRFAPDDGSDPYMVGGTRPCIAFWNRWEKLYKETPPMYRAEISKRIGWGKP